MKSQNKNVLLPMLRNLAPSMIADQLVSVQPMTVQTGKLFVMKNRYYYSSATIRLEVIAESKFDKFGVRVNVSTDEFTSIVQYCTDVLSFSCSIEGSVFWFSSESDRELFLLRWS